MVRFLVQTLMLCLGLSTATARLAETREECEKHYGGPGKVIPAVVVESDPDALIFHQEKVDITVHFKAGRVWHISYMTAALSDLERQGLLTENLQSASWLPAKGERIGDLLFWRSSDGMAIASVLDRVDVILFEVMTRACAERISAQREARILRAQSGSKN